MTTGNKKPYVRPAMTRISLADTERFKGSYLKARVSSDVDGHPVRRLLHDFGSPLYVVSEASLRRTFRRMRDAFAKRYPRATVAYSYKTNYLSGICAILHREGAWAEVVSGLEYEMARRLAVPGSEIVFNGPHKSPAEMGRAFADGAAVNLDSFDDLQKAEQVADTLGRKARVGIRVNMQLNYPAWDKFGFGLESGQAYDACRIVARHRHLHLAGLHCHVGTFVIDLSIYRRLIENLLSLAVKIRETLGVSLEYLDIGGGFPSANTLHSQLMPAETTSPTPEQYAETICEVLNRRSGELGAPVRLLLEPGRSVVDECMSLLSTVVAVKEYGGGRFAVIDAGVNLLPTAYYYKFQILSDREGAATEQIDLVGPLCMQIDVVRKGATLPRVQVGDALTIRCVGAYNFSQSMSFIFPRPAVVLVGAGGAEILRRAETYDDIKGPERVPERLIGRSASP